MTKIGQKLIMLLIVIGAMAMIAAGCPGTAVVEDGDDNVGADSPSFEEASDDIDRPFKEEFVAVDLGISRDVIEREDVLGAPSVSEPGRAIYVESDDVGDKTIQELIEEASQNDGTYLITQYNGGVLTQISREWYQGGENGFQNSEHRAVIDEFEGIEEGQLSEDDSKIVRFHNALREKLDDDGSFGQMAQDEVTDLLGEADMVTNTGTSGDGQVELVYFDQDPGDTGGAAVGDVIIQQSREGNRTTLTVRIDNGFVVMALIGHATGGAIDISGSDSGEVYTRFTWSKAYLRGASF